LVSLTRVTNNYCKQPEKILIPLIWSNAPFIGSKNTKNLLKKTRERKKNERKGEKAVLAPQWGRILPTDTGEASSMSYALTLLEHN
jgi:hypothetical protein